VRWVVATVLHNSSTAPTITWAVKHAWDYETWVTNMIQFLFDGSTAFYVITPYAS
jgi:hypothetical protein